MSEGLSLDGMDDRKSECSKRLAVLGMQLQGGRFAVELADDGGALLVVGPDAADGTVTVTCAPREEDAGTLWFFGNDEPLAEADQAVTAVVGIRGILAGGGGR